MLTTLILLLTLAGCGGGNTNGSNGSDRYRTFFNPDAEPFFPYQWYLSYSDNDFTRTVGVDPDASIHIRDAWKITRGEGVKVAIIDNNFEVTHPDLAANIADYYNADFQNKKVENSVSDESSHGTATAGFVAAVPNGYGILGTAPDSRLLLIAQVYADDAATIRAFEYARKEGAKVMSNSWGTGNVSDAIAEELANLKAQNITIFFASGNNGPTPDNDNQNLDAPGVNDESELPSVIGIGATNEYNRLATYSNYGSNIDLLAPGGEMIGLLGLDDSGEKGVAYTRYLFRNGYELQVDDAHAFKIGTSFACPLAAGVGALMLSANPALTPDQVRTILIQTADKIESDNVYYDENGFNQKRAYGKINAAKAVEMAKNYQQQTP